jgi:hypothetical protein
MSNSKRPADCHPERPHRCKGMCANCYDKHRYDTNPKRKAWYKNEENRLKRNARVLQRSKLSKERARRAAYIKTYQKTEKRQSYIKQYNKTYSINRRKKDPIYKLGLALRSRLNNAIRNNQKKGSAVRDLGCSIAELKQHLESLFQPGMTWENWTFKGWHIDHIIPLSAFDLTDREQLLKACHYTNLQPLWAKDNLSKGGVKNVKR